jgi:serpin B
VRRPTFIACLAVAAIALAAGESEAAPARPGTPAAAVTAFGVDLMPHVGGRGNMVFSPYSIATVLAMAGTGAAGTTATQIDRVLHVRSAAQIGTLSGALARDRSPGGPQLDVANGLFVQQDFTVLAPFTAALTSGFGAPPQPVDFAGAPAAATAAVNRFVSQHTAGVIPTILPGELDTSTRLALVNAIYLKAAWASPFPMPATSGGAFHAAGGKRTVQLMHETDTLPYARGRGYQALELPYAGSTFALLVLKPAHGEAALEKTVTPALLAHAEAALRPANVALTMPRFHVSLAANLNAALERLGMKAAFDAATADFSGISPTPLYVSFVAHDADFTVDEQGTVATAATVGGISATSVEVSPRPAVTLRLDRPFPFYLIDTKTGAVIFAGRLSDPAR